MYAGKAPVFFCFTIAALKTREPVLKNTGSLLKERDTRKSRAGIGGRADKTTSVLGGHRNGILYIVCTLY